MSKKIFIQALALARDGCIAEALELLGPVNAAFVRRRLAHYKSQPDHREAALRLEGALLPVTSGPAARPLSSEARSVFQAPLPPAHADSAPEGAIDFDRPESFLSWVSADWDHIPWLDLDALQYMDVWALVALGALRLEDRPRRPPIRHTGESGPARFAHALGLDALSGGRGPLFEEPSRTVRLTRVRKTAEVEPTAERMASLVITDQGSEHVRRAVRYVLVELLRNVLQHSEDALGAVVAAQRMDALQRRARPMIQLAVADAGIGIPRSLYKAHPHLVDYRQALERALLPHISGTFSEGLTGSFENAGLGLYMISEMARQTNGRLLIATTGAALVLQSGGQSGGAGDRASPRFLLPHGTGFPGTLVAFEIPTDAVQDYHALMHAILGKARERTPRRAADRWLSFGPASGPAERIALLSVSEDTPAAADLSRARIRPALVDGRTVELDFAGLDLCTQSWLHALLFEPVRLAWAMRVPICVVNADPAVREGLRFLEAYALGG